MDTYCAPIDPELQTDHQVKDLIKQTKQQAGMKWVSAIIYLLVVCNFIAVGLLQNEIYIRSRLAKTIRDTMENPVWMSDPDRNVETITTFGNFVTWFRNSFP
jgi:hypothetical protein